MADSKVWGISWSQGGRDPHLVPGLDMHDCLYLIGVPEFQLPQPWCHPNFFPRWHGCDATTCVAAGDLPTNLHVMMCEAINECVLSATPDRGHG
jgi:hypothetical protein